MPHRAEAHTRLEDWLEHFPPGGLRAMCEWDRFCTFAREPERRKVANDARVSVGGVLYQVDPNLAGETVVLWWGLFDQELYVEHSERRYGPYQPLGGPIPLHRYRRFKKTVIEQRAERIEALAAQLVLPRAAVTGLADALHLDAPPAPLSNPLSLPIPSRNSRTRRAWPPSWRLRTIWPSPWPSCPRSSSPPSRRC